MAAGKVLSLHELTAYFHQKGIDVRSMDWIRSAQPLINKMLESQSRMAFHTQTSPGGVSWPAVLWRANGSTGHGLRVTSELMASVTSTGLNSVRRLEGPAIIFGTNSIKAFHNKGGLIQRRNSKFLTIPATKEAMYVGGMRNFPRKLRIVWNESRGKGFAYEMIENTPKRRGGRRGSGARRAGKASRRGKGSRLARLIKRAQKAARSLASRFFRRKKPVKTLKARKAKTKKPKRRMVIHYFLRTFVIVPQRQFLEITDKTKEKAAKILVQQLIKHVHPKGP